MATGLSPRNHYLTRYTLSAIDGDDVAFDAVSESASAGSQGTMASRATSLQTRKPKWQYHVARAMWLISRNFYRAASSLTALQQWLELSNRSSICAGMHSGPVLRDAHALRGLMLSYPHTHTLWPLMISLGHRPAYLHSYVRDMSHSTNFCIE